MPSGPRNLREDQKAMLIQACQTGVPPSLAAKIAGVNERSFKRWMAKGKAGVEEYVDLYNEVEAAKAKVVYLLTSKVLEAIHEANPNIAGRLALDALKCYYPQYFSTGRHQIETTVSEEPLDLAAEIVGHSLQAQSTDRRVKDMMTGTISVEVEVDETD